MTNVEIMLNEAIAKLNENKLNSYEAEFVNNIKDYMKKELKSLTTNQYKLLRKIANK